MRALPHYNPITFIAAASVKMLCTALFSPRYLGETVESHQRPETPQNKGANETGLIHRAAHLDSGTYGTVALANHPLGCDQHGLQIAA